MSHTHTAIDFWKEFLAMYRSMPELWLVRSKLYRDRQLKLESYTRLLELLRTTDGHANIHTLKRKINNFRTSYRRELRKVLASGNTYKPSLWYFVELDFLYELETGELQLEDITAVDRDRVRNPIVLRNESKKSVALGARLAEQEVPISFVLKQEIEVDEDISEDMHQFETEDADIMSDTFNHEEDMLRIDAVGDGDVEPEAEPDNDPELDNMEDHVEDYRNNSSAESITVSSHLQHNGESQTSDKSGRRIRSRSRRSRSSNDTDYVDTARKRRNVETSNRDRDWHREREGKHESDSEYECELMGKRVASHFRRMRPDQRLFAERIISEVLVYGRLNRLSFEAQFSLGQK
ncbi:uncharacterized protein LOC117146660 isoform X1 [Drosophila mauritiana]|uniref:Uncharacterized protein LOC117146660 isoform X1 n=1 Tax=Drosophila mauritiana TaxID=7226 RepID=A0A6P8KIQ2_DROMA|nr:uncharacterized protein LOC117146660 isoform X1 [Drosophila mauritiana]